MYGATVLSCRRDSTSLFLAAAGARSLTHVHSRRPHPHRSLEKSSGVQAAATLIVSAPRWEGHLAGQYVNVRLTAHLAPTT